VGHGAAGLLDDLFTGLAAPAAPADPVAPSALFVDVADDEEH
jgi:hypothetical protein